MPIGPPLHMTNRVPEIERYRITSKINTSCSTYSMARRNHSNRRIFK